MYRIINSNGEYIKIVLSEFLTSKKGRVFTALSYLRCSVNYALKQKQIPLEDYLVENIETKEKVRLDKVMNGFKL